MFSDAVGSILTAGGAGAIIKIGGGLLNEWLKGRRQAMEIERDKWLAMAKVKQEAYEKFTSPKDSPATQWTLNTRRILAVSICGTFCAIAILCTIWPSATLVVLDPQPAGELKFLGGLFSFKRAATPTVTITSGAIVWAQLHILSMVIAAYFTPVGKT